MNFYCNYSSVIMNKVVTPANSSDINYYTTTGGTYGSEECYVQVPMKYKIHDKGGSTAYDSTENIMYKGRVGNQVSTLNIDTAQSCNFSFDRSISTGSRDVTECKIGSVTFSPPYIGSLDVGLKVVPNGDGKWTEQLYYRAGSNSWMHIENNAGGTGIIAGSGTLNLDFTYQ